MVFFEHNLVAEPISGLRVWRVGTDGKLESYIRAFFWEPGTIEATCSYYQTVEHHHKFGVDIIGCHCGFWAMKFVDNLLAYGLGTQDNMAWGEIELWGIIIEGDLGYRAQFARIKRVWLPIEQSHLKSKTEKQYNIPVEVSAWKLGNPLEQLKLPHL